LDRMKCSEEVVVLGILRVIEEILENKPNAQVVINSLFPMVRGRGAQYPLVNDFKDSINEHDAASSLVVRRPADPNAPPPGAMSPRKSAGRNPFRPKKIDGGGGTRRGLRFRSRDYANPLPPRKEPQTEAAMAEEAETEEAARDKAYHKKHDKKIKRPRPRPESGTLGDPRKHKIRKYNAQRAFMAKNKIPLWTSIEAINDQLRKFAASHERVSFFDVNDIFTITDATNVKRGSGVAVLNRSRMSPRGHPTEKGYSIWEDAILKRLDKLFEVMKRDQPELFFKKAAEDDDGSSSDWAGDGAGQEDDDFDASAFDAATDDLYEYGPPGGARPMAGALASSVNGVAYGQNAAPMGNQGGARASSVNGFTFAYGQNAAPMGNQGGTGDGVTSGGTGTGGPGTGTQPVPAVNTGGSMYGPIRPAAAAGTDKKSDMYDALANAGPNIGAVQGNGDFGNDDM
jgi:hypothetical protein